MLTDRCHLVDHAHLIGSLGVDVDAGEHELHRHLVGQPRHRAGDQAATEADLGLRVEEVGVVGRNGEIAVLDEHVGAADAVAGHRGDHRLVEVTAHVGDALPQVGVDGRILEVGPDRERLLPRAGQHGDPIVGLLQPIERIPQLRHDLLAQRVHLLRTVDRDRGDPFVRLVQDDVVAHGVAPRVVGVVVP